MSHLHLIERNDKNTQLRFCSKIETMAGSTEDARKVRRQRLLRFSEERFKKILKGDDDSDQKSDTTELSQSTLQTEDSCSLSPSESHPAEDINIGLRHRTEGPSSRSVSKELTPEASLPKTEKAYAHKTIKTNDAFAESKFPGITTGGSTTTSQRGTPSPLSSTTTSTSSAPGGSRVSTGNGSKATLSLLHFDLARLVSCMILAFITRKILNSSWSLFFAESIIVPFTLLQFGFYTFLPRFCKAVVLPKRGSLIDSGLALCGVDRSIIDTYQRVIAYTTSIAEDFAVYMFTFFLVDSLIG